MKLHVRFPPSADYSWPGYLLQLAHKNGLRDLDRLLTLLGITKRVPTDARNWSSELLDSLLSKLSTAVDTDETVLLKLVERHDSSQWLDVVPEIGDLRLATPRVCLQCLVERNGNHDWRWQLPTFSSCALHKTALHSHCPCCGQVFLWKAELYTRCPNCKVQWSTLSHEVVERTDLEAQLWSSVSHTDLKDHLLLTDVTRAMIALARPFDVLRQRMQNWPLCAGQSELTHDAYQLLSHPHLVEKWEMACTYERQALAGLSVSAVLAPVRQWQSQSQSQQTVIADSHTDVSQTVLSFREYSEFLKPSRAKLIQEKSDNEARYQVDRAQLAALVQLQAKDLLPLINSDVLTMLNETQLLYSQLFDARQLLLMKDVAINKQAEKTLKLSPNSAVLRKHLIAYRELLYALCVGGITGNTAALNNWSTIFVSEKALTIG